MDPRMMAMMQQGGGPQLLQRGIGGDGPMGGGALPPGLTPQMQPAASPEAAMMGGMGGAMQDPRIMAYIQALRGMGGMPR